MRRQNRFTVQMIGLALAATLSLQAQISAPLPPPPPPDAVPNFSTETREVTLHVSVLDKDGRLITDIPKENFKVFENGEQQDIKLFRREDVPVSMGILIDSSGSMRDRQLRVNAAALALVRYSNPDDEVFFVTFSDDPQLIQDFTSDIDKLEEAMGAIDSRGGTAMRNAVRASMDHMMENAKHDKRVLVVVTDGADNASTETKLEDLVREVRDSEVLVYAIGLLNDEDRRERKAAERALDALADASGGHAYYPENLEEVEALTPQIAKEIRNQYTIAYEPKNKELDGTYREIKVEVDGIGKHEVRHRTGYFADPPEEAPPTSRRDPAIEN